MRFANSERVPRRAPRPASAESRTRAEVGSGTGVIEPEVTMLSVEAASPSNPANELKGGCERLNGLTAPPVKPAEVVNSRKVAPLEKRNTSQGTPPHLDAGAPAPLIRLPPPLSSRQGSGPMH